MIQLPQSRIWEKANNSNLFGTMFVTKNLTFDEEGYLKLSYSPRGIIDESIDADVGLPVTIVRGEDYPYFLGTSDETFDAEYELLDTRPTQIATAGVTAPGIDGDAKYISGQLIVSSSTDVDYYTDSTNTWTDTNISLTSGVQHPIESFISLAAVAIANGNTVRLYQSPLTATPTLIRTLTIPSDFEIIALKYFNQNLYIATNNVFGGKAYMFVWNGLGSAAQSAFEVDSNILFNLESYRGTIVGLSGSGALLSFNGSGFDLLAAFPIYYTDMSISGDGNPRIYRNSILSNDEILYILFTNSINDSSPSGTLTYQPEGVWCFDPKVGLYHRYSTSASLTLIESIVSGSVNTTNNTITVTSAPVTGTEVVFTEQFGLAPLVNGTKYYVIKVDSTTIKLAETLADALANNPIDFTSVSGTNKFTFYPNVDFGQFYSDRAFSLYVIERPVQNRLYGTDAIFGFEVFRRDNTGNYNTYNVSVFGVESRGYFITPQILSPEVKDDFNELTLKFVPLKHETDKIIIKYRTTDDVRDFITLGDWGITWTSSTTFTTTQEAWAEAKTAYDAGKKYEVEILTGGGAGILAHIQNITESSGTYTVTIDETYDNYVSGDIGKAIFRNFIKFKTIEYDTSEGSDAQRGLLFEQLGVKGKFIQIKVELRGENVKISDLLVDNIYRLAAYAR